MSAQTSDYRPFETWNYRLDDSLLGEDEPEGNRLLDDEGNPRYSAGALGGLSAIAAALNKHGNDMTADQLEKAVWWLKDWQMHRQGWYRKATGVFDFAKRMGEFKESAEFRGYEKRARRYIRLAALTAIVAGVLLALVVGTWGESGWLWRLGWSALALITAGLASGLTDTARQQWQTQDRIYFLNCLRNAECTEDLLDAGLFAHHDDTMQLKDTLRSRRAVRRMQRQLAQALYFDYDSCIRENFLIEHAKPLRL